ncbi:MAG: bifunctional alpha,alpha-trehalose-phosphate synthase (UDP-forming)/trehalose-phosphatase [Candidatus Aminicenantaceae bacterium]
MVKKGEKGKKRIIVVSNRLPVSIKKEKGGTYSIEQSPGGLATGLRSLQKEGKAVLIGWPNFYPKNEEEKEYLENILEKKHQCYPVFLNKRELDKYYYGFSNSTLWPLFHYFSSYCTFEFSDWNVYKNVNQKFFYKVREIANPNDIIWIHDYHLMILPHIIRQAQPDSTIGFFLHIPFPSSEIFRILPWRREILEGLLGADLIGFHTYEYTRHFISSVLRILGYEHEFGSFRIKNRIVRVGNFPMGIDAKKFEELSQTSSIIKKIDKQKKDVQATNKKIILSVDRLDYSKGIPKRLEAFELFLEKNKKWHGRFIYIMLCVPSRTIVKDYSLLKQKIDELIGRINGRFGKSEWVPIHYLYRSLPFEELFPLYSIADVGFVTPVRDGMNLVAKEYIAAKNNNKGVLILSETAGASAELSEAMLVNVNSREALAAALKQALEMKEKEQNERMNIMRKRIFKYDIYLWIKYFIETILYVKNQQSEKEQRKLNRELKNRIVSDYKNKTKRLIFLDYDGTLVSFASRPELAVPDVELKRILKMLAADKKNRLVIISGRDHNTIEKWLGNIKCSLVAEHGAWIKENYNRDWNTLVKLSTDWKEELTEIFRNYEINVPGSIVEEKDYSLVWHYRKASPELGEIRSKELFEYLSDFLANTDLQVLHGNKVIEVTFREINKGVIAEKFIKEQNWDFILAIGDDWTDEDLFKNLPEFAYSINIGLKETHAKYYLESSQDCRELLLELLS